MAISIKKVKGRRYAYQVHREGKRWIQSYVGAADDPRVTEIIAKERAGREVPESVRNLFWETAPSKLDLSRHGSAIIRKVLEFGDLGGLEWTLRRFGVARVERTVRWDRALSSRTREFYRLWFGLDAAGI